MGKLSPLARISAVEWWGLAALALGFLAVGAFVHGAEVRDSRCVDAGCQQGLEFAIYGIIAVLDVPTDEKPADSTGSPDRAAGP